MKPIETDRLLLRPMVEEDAEFILELLNDPSFIRNIGDRHVRTIEQAHSYIWNGPVKSYEKHGFGLYLVLLRETGEPIGMCGLIRRETLDDVDIGYALLPKFWSRGYALEAARCMKAHARDVIGLKRIVAITDPTNTSSIRVLEKLGMQFERMVRLSPDDIELKLFGIDLEVKMTSSLHQFSYHPERINPGTVYQYTKSNIDGSYPARVFIYIADFDDLEVLKFEAHGMDAAYVRAHMDWHTFSADSLDSWVLTPDGKSRLQAFLSSSYEEKTFSISWQGRQDDIRVEGYPMHLYNFDLISLNYSLRHWNDPEGELTIGILQPDFDPTSRAMLKYEGSVVIQYQGQEVRNQQPCRKYRIGGAGFQGYFGTMWVHREQLHLEDIEIPLADNPDWDTFKFNLIARTDMDAQQWAEFRHSEIRKLKQQ